MQLQWTCIGESIRFMDPVTRGDYPSSMRSLVGPRLPKFSMEQSRLVNGSFDFLGLNYYTALNVPGKKLLPLSHLRGPIFNQTVSQNTIPIEPASNEPFVYPKGLEDLLLYTKRKNNNPLIYITENGVSEVDDEKFSLKEALTDKPRIQYYHDHLTSLQNAMGQGVDVQGYFAWSLLDNFEWNSGYSVRFGINYIFYKDGLKRYPKLSAGWFKNFIQK